MIVPGVFGAGIYQISRFVDLFFLSTLEVGSYTYLAMATAGTSCRWGSSGSRWAPPSCPRCRAIAREENEEAQRLQSNAIELAMLLTVPAAAALFVRAAPSRACSSGVPSASKMR